jgi:hypothetical protein
MSLDEAEIGPRLVPCCPSASLTAASLPDYSEVAFRLGRRVLPMSLTDVFGLCAS